MVRLIGIPDPPVVPPVDPPEVPSVDPPEDIKLDNKEKFSDTLTSLNAIINIPQHYRGNDTQKIQKIINDLIEKH